MKGKQYIDHLEVSDGHLVVLVAHGQTKYVWDCALDISEEEIARLAIQAYRRVKEKLAQTVKS